MRHTWMAWMLLAGTVGCVVYDEELVEDTAAPGTDRPGDRPGDAPAAETSGPLWLHPAGAGPGQTLIVALVSDGGRDLRDIADLTFYGAEDAVVVLTDSARTPDEHLLTLQVLPQAAPTEVHLLVEFADGSEEFLSDAFVVEANPSLIPSTPAPPTCD
ncbi:MAG: hypothetical protein ACI8PZ_000711 [Myxococcota bacterium]|jgi:hypothetical protein